MFKGIGVSKGIALTKAFIFKKEEIKFQETSYRTPQEEGQRFKDAIKEYIKTTEAIAEGMRKSAGDEEAGILEAHILLAEDPEIATAIDDVLSNRVTAEAAVVSVFDMFKSMFEEMDDELMKQRASDFGDIKTRLLEILTGTKPSGLNEITEECIIVAHDLTPSDTGQMNKKLVAGILAEAGGMTSHTAIIARAMNIPAVLGADGAMSIIKNGDLLIINGETGEVCVNPTEEEEEKAACLQNQIKKAREELEIYRGKRACTKDGSHVELYANIGGPDEMESVLLNGADGIGLFRTEFLFMDRKDVPSEEEQFVSYKRVAEAMNGKPVIIRTLDIGGDKDVPYLNLPKEENPFLGYRAIRLCLDRQELFNTQISALLRASAYGNIKIMLPMISTVDELRAAKKLIDAMKELLKEKGIAFDKDIEVGIMIETPAASIISDILAKECDFFSIGTNDLTQYTMAADRGNKKVAYLYETYNPAVLRSIATVITNGKKAGIMVGMCGEAAGDSLMIPFLLAAGLDEFSMTASSILPAKKQISGLDQNGLKEILGTVLELRTASEVKEYLGKL